MATERSPLLTIHCKEQKSIKPITPAEVESDSDDESLSEGGESVTRLEEELSRTSSLEHLNPDRRSLDSKTEELSRSSSLEQSNPDRRSRDSKTRVMTYNAYNTKKSSWIVSVCSALFSCCPSAEEKTVDKRASPVRARMR